MRCLTFAVLVFVGLGLPTLAADPAPKMSVQISAHKDVEYAAVRAVLSAVEKSGAPAQVSLRAGEARGLSAQIRVSPDVAYLDVAGLLDALKKAGAGRIELGGN
jgi:biopolymer transport protein ExbD